MDSALGQHSLTYITTKLRSSTSDAEALKSLSRFALHKQKISRLNLVRNATYAFCRFCSLFGKAFVCRFTALFLTLSMYSLTIFWTCTGNNIFLNVQARTFWTFFVTFPRLYFIFTFPFPYTILPVPRGYTIFTLCCIYVPIVLFLFFLNNIRTSRATDRLGFYQPSVL